MMENHFDSWADTWIAKGEKRGEKRGKEQGALEGRKELLLRQVRERYGDGVATEIAPTLDAVESSQTLDDMGVWILTAGRADDFIARILALRPELAGSQH